VAIAAPEPKTELLQPILRTMGFIAWGILGVMLTDSECPAPDSQLSFDLRS
jgi:hypothetical protein